MIRSDLFKMKILENLNVKSVQLSGMFHNTKRNTSANLFIFQCNILLGPEGRIKKKRFLLKTKQKQQQPHATCLCVSVRSPRRTAPSPGTLTERFRLTTTSKTLEETGRTPSTRSARWDMSCWAAFPWQFRQNETIFPKCPPTLAIYKCFCYLVRHTSTTIFRKSCPQLLVG